MKKYIFTESQVKNIINELKRNVIIDDFLDDVKQTKGALKYLSDEFPFKNSMESLEEYTLELTYTEFNELRDELKKFKKKINKD